MKNYLKNVCTYAAAPSEKLNCQFNTSFIIINICTDNTKFSVTRHEWIKIYSVFFFVMRRLAFVNKIKFFSYIDFGTYFFYILAYVCECRSLNDLIWIDGLWFLMTDIENLSFFSKMIGIRNINFTVLTLIFLSKFIFPLNFLIFLESRPNIHTKPQKKPS